jgi:hypothetical protein
MEQSQGEERRRKKERDRKKEKGMYCLTLCSSRVSLVDVTHKGVAPNDMAQRPSVWHGMHAPAP